MSRKYTEIEMLSDEILHRIQRCNVELHQSSFPRHNRHRMPLIGRQFPSRESSAEKSALCTAASGIIP